MTEINWNTKIKEALDQTEFMAISTVGEDGSWTCPVQFGYSEKLNLYFKSMPHAKHVQNLLKNSQISVAIFKTERFSDGEVLGLQLKGKAKCLISREDVAEAARCFYGRDPRQLDHKTKIDEHLGERAEWNFFKITLSELWCFDSRVFGEERKAVDLAKLTLDFRP